MQIFVVGMNHKSAPIALRERFAFSPSATDDVLGVLMRTPQFYESMVLSTCNRTEIYGVSEITPDYVNWVVEVLARQKAIPPEQFRPSLYQWSGPDAVEHLFKVVCGIDSMVLGETEVLGQVKKAYERASNTKNIGKILHRLFQRSFHLAKTVHNSYGTGLADVSVSSVAVDLAKKIFSELQDCRVMIVGAGDIGEKTVRHLMKAGARSIVASNRSFDRARQIAETLGGEAVDLDHAIDKMAEVDIVISSTASPHILFTRDQVRRLMLQRRGRPIFFIDIAVPRDIDPRINELDNVFLYNIDDLNQLCHARSKQRDQYIQQGSEWIAKEIDGFFGWFGALGVAPTIKRLTTSMERIRDAELQKSLSRLRDLLPDQKNEIDYLTKRIVSHILHAPQDQLKKFANRKDGYYYTETLSDLFQLTSEEPTIEGPTIEGHDTNLKSKISSCPPIVE